MVPGSIPGGRILIRALGERVLRQLRATNIFGIKVADHSAPKLGAPLPLSLTAAVV